jgi:tRNA-binding EMAP/Myf-like protein
LAAGWSDRDFEVVAGGFAARFAIVAFLFCCNFEDFSKLDLRVGTILEAERVPKTDKLLKLKIDTGIDVRTVVSGIAEWYKPYAPGRSFNYSYYNYVLYIYKKYGEET